MSIIPGLLSGSKSPQLWIKDVSQTSPYPCRADLLAQMYHHYTVSQECLLSWGFCCCCCCLFFINCVSIRKIIQGLPVSFVKYCINLWCAHKLFSSSGNEKSELFKYLGTSCAVKIITDFSVCILWSLQF